MNVLSRLPTKGSKVLHLPGMNKCVKCLCRKEIKFILCMSIWFAQFTGAFREDDGSWRITNKITKDVGKERVRFKYFPKAVIIPELTKNLQ